MEYPYVFILFISCVAFFLNKIVYFSYQIGLFPIILKANLQEEEIAKFADREPRELKGFSPHCFRHTFITRCKKRGIPYETIKSYVGHSKEEMTAYYDQNKPEIDYENLKKISFLNVV